MSAVADRYSFTSPFGRGGFGPGGHPWFRIGNVDVTTTVFLIGVGVIYLFVWAFESGRDISQKLWLGGGALGSPAEIWRVFTWPVVNDPDFWVILMFAFFFIFGSQMESVMGRRHYTFFIGALVIVPAVIATVLDAAFGIFGLVFGLRFVELGVLVAFAAQYPQQRFIFNIPAPVFVGGIIVLDALQQIDDSNDLGVLMLLLVSAVALVALKSLGYATEVAWIPAVPLPASVTGTSQPAATPRPRARKRRRSGGHLSAVPQPREDPLADVEIDALLDQVADQGLDSLTKEQRKRLEDHSRRLRKKRDGGS